MYESAGTSTLDAEYDISSRAIPMAVLADLTLLPFKVVISGHSVCIFAGRYRTIGMFTFEQSMR
jgi:hypothetical protein